MASSLGRLWAESEQVSFLEHERSWERAQDPVAQLPQSARYISVAILKELPDDDSHPRNPKQDQQNNQAAEPSPNYWLMELAANKTAVVLVTKFRPRTVWIHSLDSLH